MTMLNGEPIDNPIQSTAPSSSAVVTPVTASPESQRVGFIAGIIAIFCAFVLPPLGAVIGGIAVNQARQGGYRNRLAVAGLVLGIVVTLLIAAAIVANGLLRASRCSPRRARGSAPPCGSWFSHTTS